MSVFTDFMKRAEKLSVSVTKVAQMRHHPMVKQVALPLMLASVAGLSGCAATPPVETHNLTADDFQNHVLTSQELSEKLGTDISVTVFDGSIRSLLPASQHLVAAAQSDERLTGFLQDGVLRGDQVSDGPAAVDRVAGGLKKHLSFSSRASAFPIREGLFGGTATCEVFVANQDVVKEPILQRLSKLPSSIYEPAVGNEQIWTNAVLLHESVHCLQGAQQDDLRGGQSVEHGADLVVQQTLENANLTDEAQAYRGARLVSSFLQPMSKYDYGYTLSREARGLEGVSQTKTFELRHEVDRAMYKAAGEKLKPYQIKEKLQTLYKIQYAESESQTRAHMSPMAQDLVSQTVEGLKYLAPTYHQDMVQKYQGASPKMEKKAPAVRLSSAAQM